MKARLEYIIKHNSFVQVIYRYIMSSVFRIMGLFIKTDDSLVLLTSYSGKKYDDSPRVIFESMLERDDCKQLKFVWGFNNPHIYNLPRSHCIKIDSLEYFITALRAKYWITNVNIERGLRFKKPQTIYVNTWHGTPIKKIGNAVKGRKDYNFSNVDIITTDGPFLKGIMERDFNAKPSAIITCGRPREDELYSLRERGLRDEIANKIGVNPDASIILYAPTWRDSEDGGESFSIKPPISTEKWKQHLGDNHVVLFRAHSITNSVLGIEFDKKIIDCSDYPNVNELMYVADVLVSDYSGILFDYASICKPMLCFAYDYEDYSTRRGLYFDIRDYITTFTNESDLLAYLLNYNYDFEIRKTKEFFDEFSGYGGNATQTCINRMLFMGNNTINK